jgi:hypothetical protein
LATVRAALKRSTSRFSHASRVRRSYRIT